MTNLQQEVAVEVEDDDGRPVALTIRPPNPAVRRQIERATRKAYCEAIRAGHPTDEQAGSDHVALCGDEAWQELREAIMAGAGKLEQADLSLAERRDIALAMRANRSKLLAAVAAATRRKPTADSMAAQVHFESALALCVYGPSGQRLFKSSEDYRCRDRDPFSYRVAEAVSRLLYGLGEDERTEERFLREHTL